MDPVRQAAVDSLRRESGVDVELVTEADLARWTVPHHPIPEAFWHLSPVHQSDYLRAYLMHHHGGGYADVKRTSGSWIPAFEALDADESLLGAGYREVGRHGVAEFGLRLRRHWDVQPLVLDWWRYRWLQLHHRSLIGLCAFVLRPGTALTTTWMAAVDQRLLRLAPALATHPSRVPKERPGVAYDGFVSEYPVPWTHLLGDVFHPLVRRYRRRILKVVPTPLWPGQG